jgi:hypothetical protein
VSERGREKQGNSSIEWGKIVRECDIAQSSRLSLREALISIIL